MKQTNLKEVSPLLQRIINWSSIIGALGTLAFCIWAYFSGILHLRPYYRDHLQLHRDRDWLCHYLLPFQDVRTQVRAINGQSEDLRQVRWLAQ